MEDQDKEKTEVEWMDCSSILDRSHLGIKCAHGHDICPKCCKHFIKSIMNEPLTMIPVKCPICKAELNSLQVEMHMDETQKSEYIAFKTAQGTRNSRFCPQSP